MDMKIAKTIIKLEKFFKIKKPNNMNYIEWSEKLYDMTNEWEDEYQEPFPWDKVDLIRVRD